MRLNSIKNAMFDNGFLALLPGNTNPSAADEPGRIASISTARGDRPMTSPVRAGPREEASVYVGYPSKTVKSAQFAH
jgi:hypothetical protein